MMRILVDTSFQLRVQENKMALPKYYQQGRNDALNTIHKKYGVLYRRYGHTDKFEKSFNSYISGLFDAANEAVQAIMSGFEYTEK